MIECERKSEICLVVCLCLFFIFFIGCVVCFVFVEEYVFFFLVVYFVNFFDFVDGSFY